MRVRSVSGHTRGPWKACHDGECKCGHVWAMGDKHIATVHRATTEDGHVYVEWSPEERAANAVLIAAAPELARQLSHLVELLEPLEQSGALNVPGLATLNGARAALAKARGEQT